MLLTLQPTFTQGLLLGQLSILFLLAVILKYLFFDSGTEDPHATLSYQPRSPHNVRSATSDDSQTRSQSEKGAERSPSEGTESADWLNAVLQQVLNAYRTKLRDSMSGAEGDEIARKKVEVFANQMRPQVFVDPIKVHSVDLGIGAPRLSNARRTSHAESAIEQIELDITYTDTLSISVSTAVLFNYPFASFARLPVSLTISLSLFSSAVLLDPPSPQAEHPTITITLPPNQPDFILNLKTTSLMGSRAKLADVPKLHELIVHQIRKAIFEKGTWRVVLPGLASVKEVKADIERERDALGRFE